jgi:hypothetical protein
MFSIPGELGSLEPETRKIESKIIKNLSIPYPVLYSWGKYF